MNKLENFIQAFNQHIGSCRNTCECGREFYNDSNDWSWEDGELESLQNDPNATRLEYSVPLIAFENNEYVPDCDCWIERAKKIINFIDFHADQIAEYLTLEKKRKTIIAENSPIVK